MNSIEKAQFLMWYAQQAQRHRLDPDYSNPLHFYDWERAWQSGARADASGHWPSEYKRLGHPNLIINGIDTRTGMPATPETIRQSQMAAAAVRRAGYR